jgi:thiol:disulfide interchange protein DsbD
MTGPARARRRPGSAALAALALAAAMAASPAAGASGPAGPGGSRVAVELISELGALEPGRQHWIGIRQRIAPGWHTYWVNPGDSGEAMAVEWTLPAGFAAGDLVWPYPERIPVGSAMSFGYTGEVVVLAPLSVPAGLAPGREVSLRASARWLVCADICIPEEGAVALTLPVASGAAPADPRGAAAIASARRAVPVPSPWRASFAVTGDTVELALGAPTRVAERVAEARFFPARWGAIEHAAAQEVGARDSGLVLRMARGPLPEAAESPLEGVLVLTERLDAGPATHALALRAAPRGRGAAAGGAGPPRPSLLQALGLALAGGLILNLMPCVLPVLSVKALGLAQHAAASRAAAAAHGLAYTAGVLISFALLAGALLALRAGGAQIGWGFQLQSPLFVTALAYVFFALGLSLSGVVAIGTRVSGVGHRLAARSGHAGSFFTGALATVAATPCTAPFMGVAVGYALAAPPGPALLVFEALGLGLALPYLALALVPAWRRHLPRPGAWMERLRRFLALPLYATAAWLLWVLGRQVGPEGALAALGGLALVAIAAGLRRAARSAPPRWRFAASGAAAASLLGAVALAWAPAATPSGAGGAAPGADAGIAWEPFTESRLARLRAEGTPVFVNATAAWCITCLVNERVALRSPAVAAAFADRRIAYLKADWTNRDPRIAAMLESFGRSGVPLYVFYPSTGAEPTVLPQVLTESTVLEAVGAAGPAGS